MTKEYKQGGPMTSEHRPMKCPYCGDDEGQDDCGNLDGGTVHHVECHACGQSYPHDFGRADE